MSQASTEYKPRLTETYGLLLEVYGNAMKPCEEESAVWCERFRAVRRSYTALLRDGVLPPSVKRDLSEDIKNVADRIHHDLDTSKLTEEQRLQTFGIANLIAAFSR